MWRQWFKKKAATLVMTDDAILLRENRRDQVLVEQALDLPQIEQCLRQHKDQLKGKQLKLVLAGAWVRVQVLPWQDHLVRREDWEALGQKALKQASNKDSEHWFCSVNLAQYGKPVLVMGMTEKLHQLLISLATELQFEWVQIKPFNILLLNKHMDAKRLFVAEPGLVTVMQLSNGSLAEVQLLKPPVGQELSGIQQYQARIDMLSTRANQSVKDKVIVSPAIKQDWSTLQTDQQNIVVVQSRAGLSSHAQWVAQQGL